MPGTEAHGGYAFCGFASLVILDKTDLCDLKTLLVCLILSPGQMKIGLFHGIVAKF